MSQPTDPQEPPTLAARLTDDVLKRAADEFDAALGHGYDEAVGAELAYKGACVAMRAVLVAALTPEPVTPPVAAPAGSFVDVAARVRQQLENEPDDDGRGLAVDMRDVDRLRDLAAHLTPHRRTWLRAFCDRLATQITETLSLRQSLRQAEQERDALQRTYDALVARCMELPGR